MQVKIHPTYYPDAAVKCNCGATYTVGSTMPEIHVEVCSNCHPFYTGKQNLIDTAGRVDQFKARSKRAAEIKEAVAAKPKKSKTVDKPETSTETLKKLKKTVTE
jgi:large subunit ribosomal protein L31